VLERLSDGLKVDFDGIQMTFYYDEIDAVDGQKVGASPASSNDVVKVEMPKGGAAAYLPSDRKEIFEERLGRFIALSETQNLTDKECAAALDLLGRFSKDFPDSRFAKDADFLVKYVALMVQYDVNDQEGVFKAIDAIEQVVNRYPDASLEDITCRTVAESPSQDMLRIPFKFMAAYLRASAGFKFKDLDLVEKQLSLIRDGHQADKGVGREFMQELYGMKIRLFTEMGRMPQAGKIARKALEQFPDAPLAGKWRELLGSK
jgi:hypothetical protein